MRMPKHLVFAVRLDITGLAILAPVYAVPFFPFPPFFPKPQLRTAQG